MFEIGPLVSLGIVAYAVAVVALLILPLFLFWRIFAKAGYSPALALFLLVPGLGWVIVTGILALDEWPVLKYRRAQ